MTTINNLIQNTGVSQTQLASALGLSQPSISYMMKGRESRGLKNFLVRLLSSLSDLSPEVARTAITIEPPRNTWTVICDFFDGRDPDAIARYVGWDGVNLVTLDRLAATLGVIAAVFPDRRAEMNRTFTHVTTQRGQLLTYAERHEKRKAAKKVSKRTPRAVASSVVPPEPRAERPAMPLVWDDAFWSVRTVTPAECAAGVEPSVVDSNAALNTLTEEQEAAYWDALKSYETRTGRMGPA